MATRTFGESVLRNEDDRLLRGNGRYVDDIEAYGALHVAFVRSTFAHARIAGVDVEEAKAQPGVVAVYTCDDIGHLDQDLPLLIPHPAMTHPRTQRPLAREEVHHVGQAIAMVVAESRYEAEDAAERVVVDYEPLPVVVDLERAGAAGSPLVHDDVPGNVACHLVQVSGDPDDAFARAEHVFKARFVVERSAGHPMETRGCLARWDSHSRELTLWDSTQASISIRGGLASLFSLPENKVRVIAPDTGGGFGTKVFFFHPDEVLVPFAAMALGRPVKYIEDRSEHFVASNQERKQIHDVEVAATKDGEILGLRDTFLHDTGAFIPYGIAVAQVASTSLPGPYRIPNLHVEFKAIYTNTTTVSPYRGCGRPHACFVMERTMDLLAQELGIDRMEIRRRNLIASDEFPYTRENMVFADGLPVTLDSGDYVRALDTVLEAIGYDEFRAEQERARAEGRWIGLGLACYVEGTGLGPYEGAHVQVQSVTGKVLVSTGLTSQGQGHETVFAQIAADQLGVDPSDVQVITGDTGAFEWGVATFASRAAVVSGNAVGKAALEVREKIIDMASNMLEAAVEDIDIAEGRIFVRGSEDRHVTLKQVATVANPLRYAFDQDAQAATQFAPAFEDVGGPPLPDGRVPGLEARSYYSPPHATWASGVHAAIVEVDMDSLEVSFLKYVLVHDCGKMINPAIVEGQVMGGVAQGVGGALYERLVYDEDGQLRNGSFMDFLIPYATEVPRLEMHHQETPSPLNVLGIKGVGEAGAIPVPALTASAVSDALRPLGIEIMEAPLMPDRLFHLVSEVDGAAGGTPAADGGGAG
jgi:carbon-monoxide dehydrogenase large subunit